MREFWVSSGHQLARRTEGGGLLVTDELLLAFLARPELVPPQEACDAERRLHAELTLDPRRVVRPGDVAALADEDAQDNWRAMLSLRDRLLAARTIEAAYLDLIRTGLNGVPPLFLGQLVHLILRNALDGCEDPYILRAAELFFRPQRVSFVDGVAILADDEIIEAQEAGAGRSPLVAMLGREPIRELDVMDDGNAWTYWSRSDAFTMAVNIGSNAKARAGLARVVEAWLQHMLHLETRVEPIAHIEDGDWRWFVGLDAEGTRIGNAVWTGEDLPGDAQSRLLALFRLSVVDPDRLDPKVAGHPIYGFMAMNPDRKLVVKPQNLLVGLPLRTGSGSA